MPRLLSVLVVGAALLATSSTAHAGSILFSSASLGEGGTTWNPAALFDFSGDTLTVTLRHAGMILDANAQSGLLFDLPDGITLTPLSAAVNGSTGGTFVYRKGTDPSDHAIVNVGSPLLDGEVVLTMAVSGGRLLESQVSNVSFQYGTDFSDSRLPGGMVAPASIPEPAMMLLLAPGIAYAVRRRVRSKAAR